MLTPKVTKCKECGSIPDLIKAIDCKLAEMSGRLYNNIVFSLNLHVPYMDMTDLLTYRRILEYKAVDPNYICKFDIPSITTKVKIITAGCKPNCPCHPGPIATTTTTTTAVPEVLTYIYNSRIVECNTCTHYYLNFISNTEPLILNKYYVSSIGVIEIITDYGTEMGYPSDNIPTNSGEDTCTEVSCPFNYVSSASVGSLSEVCELDANLTLYSKLNVMGIGLELFTDPALTTPYVGSSEGYQKFTKVIGTIQYNYGIVINSSGVITSYDFVSC